MTTMGNAAFWRFAFKVSENEVDWLGSEQLQSSFGVAGRERLEPIVAQV
jgi:hypothetical protein